MQNKKILYALSGIAAAVIISILAVYSTGADTPKLSVYEETNKMLQQKLSEHGILMSSLIKLREQQDIAKYCSFFTDEEKQSLVQYCTSTELKDNDGKFLGNIHMVGYPDNPKIILVLVQADPFMTQIDAVKTIVDDTIKTVICDCWDETQPHNFENSGLWIDGLREFHLSDTKPHSKSNELTLRGKTLQLELTTNQDGYLWQFFIYS